MSSSFVRYRPMTGEHRPGIVGKGTFVTCCGEQPHFIARTLRPIAPDQVSFEPMPLQALAGYQAGSVRCGLCGASWLRRGEHQAEIHFEHRGWWPPKGD